MAITYNDLYMDIRQILRKAGIQAATLEARELVCFGAGKTREQLLRDGRLYVPQNVEEEIQSLVQRHLAGEPVAYLIGEWEFYGLPLDISEQVLIPRSDTEVLAELAIGQLQEQEDCRVLDLCAGSGCVGLAIASQVPGARVVLGELSEGALRICRQNIRRNGLSGRVVPYQMDVLAGPPAHLGEFDCLVCNPPYIPTGDLAGLDNSVRDYEPHMALDGGEDGLDFYRAVCEKWLDVLHPGSILCFEVGIGQADSVLRLMRTKGFGDLEILPDPAGIPRVVWGRLYETVYQS
ncbi:MAG: peptide chain release factor N(5)-glutamine methyltransferase [Ruminococcaceae bacterium]|nr:peptide chain release factor N(5)-glutamine methyltransferase [Oscillospiraceae bacterium]